MTAITTYRFYKTKDGSWFIDLPEWTGPPGELQMVAGADDFLDELSAGKDEVSIEISPTPVEGFDTLELQSEQTYGGADYVLKNYQNQPVNKKMWLCDVTKFIFNNFPEAIYFKKLTT